MDITPDLFLSMVELDTLDRLGLDGAWLFDHALSYLQRCALFHDDFQVSPEAFMLVNYESVDDEMWNLLEEHLNEDPKEDTEPDVQEILNTHCGDVTNMTVRLILEFAHLLANIEVPLGLFDSTTAMNYNLTYRQRNRHMGIIEIES